MAFCESNLMPQLPFSLSEVNISDGPLFRTTFPYFDTITKAQREEIIRWYVDMLEDAFQAGLKSFLKDCSVDCSPIVFCGWTIIERNRNGQADGPPKRKQKKGTRLPEAIDIALSKALWCWCWCRR
ncbi:hypothetical protein GGR56DRAFT_430716 [Xylariaceae sp. FL0804]|nr:hypothetical protein GGR56DRAFT_430716 [Xylariaceae sp. FL0804]